MEDQLIQKAWGVFTRCFSVEQTTAGCHITVHNGQLCCDTVSFAIAVISRYFVANSSKVISWSRSTAAENRFSSLYSWKAVIWSRWDDKVSVLPNFWKPERFRFQSLALQTERQMDSAGQVSVPLKTSMYGICYDSKVCLQGSEPPSATTCIAQNDRDWRELKRFKKPSLAASAKCFVYKSVAAALLGRIAQANISYKVSYLRLQGYYVLANVIEIKMTSTPSRAGTNAGYHKKEGRCLECGQSRHVFYPEQKERDCNDQTHQKEGLLRAAFLTLPSEVGGRARSWN